MRKILLFFMLCSCLFVSGCLAVFAQRYDLETPEIPVIHEKELTLAVQDVRPDVVSGKIPEKYVGIMNHIHPVYVMDEIPFASAVSDSIKRGLVKNGVSVSVVSLKPQMSSDDVVKVLKATGKKSLLVKIREWHSRGTRSTQVAYDFVAEIYDRDGKLLGREKLATTDVYPFDRWDGTWTFRSRSAALVKGLETLLASPGLVSLL